jgi:hypothetical protein
VRGERIVVAERDLVRGSGVVLVHDWDGPGAEERRQRVAGVHVGDAVAHVGRCEQDLGCVQPLRPERRLPRPLQPGLAECRRGLQAREAARAAVEAEAAQASAIAPEETTQTGSSA